MEDCSNVDRIFDHTSSDTNITFFYFLCSDISEPETIWKKVMVYFNVLSNHSPGVTERGQNSSVGIVCATVRI